MKETVSNPGINFTEINVDLADKKDKRLLVLFLCAFLALLVHLLPSLPVIKSDSAELSNISSLQTDYSGGIPSPRLIFITGYPMPINTADIETLTMLPGIGFNLAERITKYRDLNGKITSLHMLQRIDGLGSKKIRRLKNYISFE